MVQVTLRVGCRQNGSMNAVAGSGMASMWDASIDFHPRMEEPSKPKPSSNTSSVNSPMGTLKCCQVPKVSTNFTSTIFAPCLRAFSITLFGVAVLEVLAVLMNWLTIYGFFSAVLNLVCGAAFLSGPKLIGLGPLNGLGKLVKLVKQAWVSFFQSTKNPQTSARTRGKSITQRVRPSLQCECGMH